MGCGASNVEKHAAGISKRIDDNLEIERKKTHNQFKILLLGAAEGGKSTIVKQMRIIHGTGYSASDRMHYRRIVHSNAIQSLLAILGAMEKLQIPFSDPSHIQQVQRLCQMQENESISEEMGEIMLLLWQKDVIQSFYVRSGEYQLNDSGGYFLNSLSRIS